VHTDEAVAQTVSSIMRSVRKKPVQVKRDVPGFLANRIQHAMMREAIALVDEGFASAEDVDLAVRYGFGFRYIAAGPLLQKDLAGIDIHCAAAATDRAIARILLLNISPSSTQTTGPQVAPKNTT